MTSLRDVVLVIPTKRLPPVHTIESLGVPKGVKTIIICHPSVFAAHRKYYRRHPLGNQVYVKLGVDGWAPQVMECYRQARKFGAKYYFRLDDDLGPKTFLLKDRSHPSLKQVMRWARECMDECEVSLVGFQNTSRLDWLGEGYGRSYALVTGAIQLCRAYKPEQMMNRKLERYEDVWRSLAHRRRDGAVGRVRFVGIDKKSAHGNSMINISEKQRKRAIRRIVNEFPDFITYLGDKKDSHGTKYPHFRFKRHPDFRP
jgi:hypothetical protein